MHILYVCDSIDIPISLNLLRQFQKYCLILNRFSKKKSTLLSIIVAGIVGILAAPIITPHIFHCFACEFEDKTRLLHFCIAPFLQDCFFTNGSSCICKYQFAKVLWLLFSNGMIKANNNAQETSDVLLPASKISAS